VRHRRSPVVHDHQVAAGNEVLGHRRGPQRSRFRCALTSQPAGDCALIGRAAPDIRSAGTRACCCATQNRGQYLEPR
jgi:hypothetical protein